MKTQKPLLGFSLAFLATATWGALPIAAKQVLSVMNAQTLVWTRFVVAGVVLFFLLALTKRLPQLHDFNRKRFGILLLGILGLTINFVLFAEALHYISPTTNQVLWQLAPFTMILCGVFLFKEPLTYFQKMGFLLLIIGLIAFFNDKFGEILQLNTYAMGVLLGAGASIIWVIYGITQKLLLKHFSSQQVLMMIYLGCAIVLSPIASPNQLTALSGFTLICFIFCCANTLIGYGAYGEALNHWDTSKVSVITSLMPIFTMLFSLLSHYLAPSIFEPLTMNSVSYFGAFIVVFGAILAVVGDKLFRRQ